MPTAYHHCPDNASQKLEGKRGGIPCHIPATGWGLDRFPVRCGFPSSSASLPSSASRRRSLRQLRSSRVVTNSVGSSRSSETLRKHHKKHRVKPCHVVYTCPVLPIWQSAHLGKQSAYLVDAQPFASHHLPLVFDGRGSLRGHIDELRVGSDRGL